MQTSASEPRLLYLDPRQLEPDEGNARRESGDLEGLAASLRRYGVLQPLGVTTLSGAIDGVGNGRYRVVYGSRRREAAILAGLPTVPCVPVQATGTGDHLVTQLLENMQRRDLNDIEKAEGLARLRRQIAAELGPGTKAEALDGHVAELVGLAPRTVRRYLALRELPPAVRDLLGDERLTVTQAQHLAQLPSAQLQSEVAARAADEEWTAAHVSRVCAALARSSGMTVDQALDAASAGWSAVEHLGPRPAQTEHTQPAAAPTKLPRVSRTVGTEEPDGDIWLEDATGAQAPEATGAPVPFAEEKAGPGGGRADVGTADGHRVFRIRTLAAFCDEADRLARCVQDGDLQRSTRGDATAATRLRLAAKQLGFTLNSVEALIAELGG
ncbi:MAG: ParB/RepB/Spo0J family partition protein [Chloroflexi bacterium]|nr:ParB/RepB/Spo0J family partition protein [Chloroflexota bacterium]